eukprot:Pgem_evm1s12079
MFSLKLTEGGIRGEGMNIKKELTLSLLNYAKKTACNPNKNKLNNFDNDDD